MKRTVRLVVLGAMLHGGAQAAGQDAAPEPSLNTVRHPQAAHPAARKQKAVQSRKSKVARTRKVSSKSRLGIEATDPKTKNTRGTVTETPAESTEQTIQLKGVRG